MTREIAMSKQTSFEVRSPSRSSRSHLRSRPRRNSLPAKPAAATAPEVVVHVGDLPATVFYELEAWKDPASPGGKMVGVTHRGDELEPPPENDPTATFNVKVQAGVPYRLWIRMKVGAAKGVSQANLLFVQFSGAVDDAIRRPR